MKKIAIITTHPIQYNAPLFQKIAERKKIELKVFYTWEQAQGAIFDKKFGKNIEWDIPLLKAYDFEFIKNKASKPGSSHFRGVINPELIEKIKNWHADAILVYGWNHHSHFKTMRYFKGKIPVYFRGDSTLLDATKGIKILLRRIALRYIYRYVDKAFYVGTNNKAYYLAHGLNENQLLFAPHAIDNDRFGRNYIENREKAKKQRKEFGFSDDDVVFLFVGKFECKKNPLLLLKIAKQIPRAKFLFVGQGELEIQMKQESGKNVYFLPFQNQTQMPVIYRVGDVLVLPSSYDETWGLAVNEAMACGRAVVVSDRVGCAVDLVEQEKNGYIFTLGDEFFFRKVLKQFVDNKEKIIQMGDFSKQKIQMWSFESISMAIEKELT